MNPIRQSGFLFTNFKSITQTPFEKLFEIFKELITYTSGDFEEAINWLKELDKEYVLTSEDYTMDDFIEDLFKKGYIKKELNPNKSQNMCPEASENTFGHLGFTGTVVWADPDHDQNQI